MVSSTAGTAARMSPRTIARACPAVGARTTAMTPAGTAGRGRSGLRSGLGRSGLGRTRLFTHLRHRPRSAARPARRRWRGGTGRTAAGPGPFGLGRRRRPGRVAQHGAGLRGAGAGHDRRQHRGAPRRQVRVGVEANPHAERLQRDRLPGRIARAAPGELDFRDPLAGGLLHRVEHVPGAEHRPGQYRPGDLGLPVLGGQPEQQPAHVRVPQRRALAGQVRHEGRPGTRGGLGRQHRHVGGPAAEQPRDPGDRGPAGLRRAVQQRSGRATARHAEQPGAPPSHGRADNGRRAAEDEPAAPLETPGRQDLRQCVAPAHAHRDPRRQPEPPRRRRA